MPYLVTYLDGRTPETVEADSAAVEESAGWIVLRRSVLVIGLPREVVVRRLPAAEVASVKVV